MRDLIHNLAFNLCLAPTFVKQSTHSQSLDCQGFDSITFVSTFGEGSEAPSELRNVSLTCQWSQDKQTWGTAKQEDILGLKVDEAGTLFVYDHADKANTIKCWGYCGPGRYVRVQLAVTGEWNQGVPLSILMIGGHAHHAPAHRTQGGSV